VLVAIQYVLSYRSILQPPAIADSDSASSARSSVQRIMEQLPGAGGVERHVSERVVEGVWVLAFGGGQFHPGFPATEHHDQVHQVVHMRTRPPSLIGCAA